MSFFRGARVRSRDVEFEAGGEVVRAPEDEMLAAALAVTGEGSQLSLAGGRPTVQLKACLRLLRRISNDAVRPPQPPATADEYRILEQALHGVTTLANASHDAHAARDRLQEITP